MKKTSLKKKAIEPLIATILLVVVSVIIVTIVLNWGKIFSSDALSQTQTISLKKSDAEHYIFGDTLRNGTVTFRYSPPSGSSFDDYEITRYKILSDLGESEITSLGTSHSLRQGTNAINLKGFLGLEIIPGQRTPENSKVTILLITDKNQFLTLSNLTNTVTEVFVDLPWVMYNGRKLYIQPSGSNYNGEGDFSGTVDVTKNWSAAISYCETLNAHGYDDWYLPTIDQLVAIYYYEKLEYYGGRTMDSLKDSINNNHHLVPLKSDDGYWSSTEYSGAIAYGMYMLDGFMYGNDKSYEGYVRCVRDP